MNIVEFCATKGIKATDHGEAMTAIHFDLVRGEVYQEPYLARRIQLELKVGERVLESWVEIDVELIKAMILLAADLDENKFICEEIGFAISALECEARK